MFLSFQSKCNPEEAFAQISVSENPPPAKNIAKSGKEISIWGTSSEKKKIVILLLREVVLALIQTPAVILYLLKLRTEMVSQFMTHHFKNCCPHHRKSVRKVILKTSWKRSREKTNDKNSCFAAFATRKTL